MPVPGNNNATAGYIPNPNGAFGEPISFFANNPYPMFTPSVSPSSGALAFYANPLASSFAANAKSVGIAAMVPYYSGPTGLQIVGWDLDITVGSTGGTIYAACYLISNQNQPFKYAGLAAGTNYATLLATAGSGVSTGVGRLLVTSFTPITIQPNMWFLFGGYNDISAATALAGTGVAGVFSPYGKFTVAGAGSTASVGCIDIDVPGLSGGSFPSVIPDSVGNQGSHDLGIAIKVVGM